MLRDEGTDGCAVVMSSLMLLLSAMRDDREGEGEGEEGERR